MDSDEQSKNWHFADIVKPKKKNTPSSNAAATASPEPLNSRIVQNFILVWLDPRNDEMSDNNFHNSITKLRRVINSVNIFTDADQCIDFVTNINEEKILMIISTELCQDIVPLLHDINQINSMYIFRKNEKQHNQWTQQWSKVKGVFTTVTSMCQALKQDAHKCDQDSILISFVPTSIGELGQNLDQLDPTFMYTQILKEILLPIDFNEQHIKDFTIYYRENFVDNAIQLNNIDEFERDYDSHCPIWWYTHECCLYSVLNRALRLMEVDAIIKMGFFIRDLHEQIAQLHAEQFSKYHQLEPFTLYRGQGLSKTDFDRMLETQGGLISFNNFLSTSKDLTVALCFARSSLANPISVGIVFVMKIDPSKSSTPFASINNVSYYKTEAEFLFSMHTIFRIGNMIQSNDNPRLWEVHLIQTNDNDPQLNALTERLRNEIRGSTEWDKLGKLLIKLGQFTKAEQLYEVLLDQTYNDREKAHFYQQLGWSKKNQKKYQEAITFYEKSLEIKGEFLPPNHPSFAVALKDIGSVYEKMNEYSKALLYHEKSLEIQLNSSPCNHSGLAYAYSNVGSVYEKMGEYSKALSFHEKAIEIRRQILPSNNPTLAYSHHNIGSVYEKMGEYPKALLTHEKAFEILKKILPSYHPDLAQSYSNIGFVYGKMCQYSKSRQFHQHAVNIGQRSLPANHPRLQQWQKNLEFAKRKSIKCTDQLE